MPYTDGPELAETLVAEKPNDIHCYSYDTEILTQDGWKTFNKLQSNDLVAQWYKDGTIEFVLPEEIVWEYYEGDMIELDNYQLITPNHRVVTINNRNNNVTIKLAQDCLKLKSQVNYPIKGFLDGKDTESYEFYELLVATQADGCLAKDCNSITFNFVKKRKVDSLLNLLNKLDVEYSYTELFRNESNQYIIKLVSKDSIVLKLRSYLNKDKTLNFNYINLSLETKRKLIKSLGYWDGTYTKNKNCIVLDTTNKLFINQIQTLAITSGFKCKISKYSKTTTYGDCILYRAYINLKTISRSSFKDAKKLIKDYSNYVGCVSVPTGMVVVRRNNGVFISGNTINANKLDISRDDAKSISYACLTGDTEVWDWQKGWIPISRIKPEIHKCISIDTQELKNRYNTNITKLHEFLDKEVYELTTKDNLTVKCTLDHRWFVLDSDTNSYKYVTTEEYFEGDYLIVRSIEGLTREISYHKFTSKKLLGVEKTYCITTDTSNFYMRQGSFSSVTGNCLYGAMPNKLSKMLSLKPEEGEKMYQDYWDALPALKELKEKVEAYWESTGNRYILGLDGRHLMARSKHSLLNLLFQGGGSIAVKYSLLFTAQNLEEKQLFGDVFSDDFEQAKEKIYQMIMYHELNVA